ncbi:DsbA family oxidoreductase [Alkalibacillus aidingensis]|uniref:DsbA family oxidoreductase n=1 Tax=Alkalibacillus aidingensis TaxID=2747607 RepID=UPI001660450B|nr:DsbA family oxidoreductase [Alkalibacillus aidingensis]
MKVEMWSDVVCPFCYIGKRRFEAALEQFEGRDQVDVILKSFQLDPTARKGEHSDIHAMLAKKYNVPYEKGKEMNNQMAEQAKEVGLEFNFDSVIPTNTKDAHRLSLLAKEKGKMYELMEQLMKAYFTEGRDVGSHDVLIDLAKDVGIDGEEARNVLAGDDFETGVEQDQQEAGQIGVQGVPFFVFNHKYAVSGAQPTETFLDVLQKVFEEEKNESKVQILNDQSKTEYCDGDSCS